MKGIMIYIWLIWLLFCVGSFDSSLLGLMFFDQFLQISICFFIDNVYGFGEYNYRCYCYDMNWKMWGMFLRDFVLNDVSKCVFCCIQLFGLIKMYIGMKVEKE